MKKNLSYIDSVHRDGTIWNLSMMVLLILFPLTVAFLFGTSPDWGALVVGLLSTAPMYWAVGIIETITFGLSISTQADLIGTGQAQKISISLEAIIKYDTPLENYTVVAPEGYESYEDWT